MDIFYTDVFPIQLPENHRFPVKKYALLRETLQATIEAKNWNFQVSNQATKDELILAHSSEYIDKVLRRNLSIREERRLGLPITEQLIVRSLHSVGATVGASRQALVKSVAVHLGGGTHHAGWDHGEGFCVFNDSVVAARFMQKYYGIKKVIIIDCDVHQGNGTAEITKNDSSIFSFSIHCQKNFPFRKYPGDMDIPLPDGLEDKDYLNVLEEGIERALAVSNPDFAIYLAGADPHKNDRLGRLSLTKDGLAQRDHLIISKLFSEQIPMAITLAGGYGKNIMDTVSIHAGTVLIANRFVNK